MNRAELRAEIARKNLSKKELAEALGISPTALFYKLTGKHEFKESEIRTLIGVLALSPDALNRIFLD